VKRAWLFLVLLVSIAAACAAACGGGEAPEAGDGHPPGAASSAAPAADGDAGAPLPNDHHFTGNMRCSRCHTAEDKKHPQWRETAMRLGHDIGKTFEDRTTCKCCHLGEVKGFGDPIDRRCAECHDDIRVTITAMGSMHCLSCHDPTASGGMLIRESAWECKKCHDKDQGDKAAIDVHATEDCANCHRPHSEPWTLPRKCTECHVGHETWHAAVRGADGGAPPPAPAPIARDGGPHAMTGEPMACATCHRPHEVAGAASGRCFTCHAAHEPEKFTAASTFPGGHDRCTTCHQPHGDGAGTGPRACRSCHTTVVTMDGRASEAHSKCVNCHQPHEVAGSARNACIGCHLSVKADHPDPKGVGCTGCHQVHPGAPARATVSTSMVAALPDTAYPKAPSPVTCSHCHTKASSDLAFHDGKTGCKTCHTPHAFTAASAPACAKCHARETAAATASAGRGHTNCRTCHEPHAPTAAKPACASCHADEAKTAPAGHAKCQICHDAHPSTRTPKAGCTTCHAQKTQGPHAPVACAQCHRAHGPDAPAGPPGAATRPDCVSCHTSPLPALHASKSHGTCNSCHGAHSAPSGDRATCLACHADKREHEPTATKCIGCHVFGRGKWAPHR
jgi:hypothetical protein